MRDINVTNVFARLMGQKSLSSKATQALGMIFVSNGNLSVQVAAPTSEVLQFKEE
jgi:hypothetical protein